MTAQTLINPDEIEIKVKKVKEPQGKPIVIVFADCKLLSGIYCLEKGKRCEECLLRFRCYTGANLEINYLKELRSLLADNLEITLSEMVVGFLEQKRGFEAKK